MGSVRLNVEWVMQSGGDEVGAYSGGWRRRSCWGTRSRVGNGVVGVGGWAYGLWDCLGEWLKREERARVE